MIKRFFRRTWGVFAALGNFISSVIGLYFCYQILRVSLSHVITLYNVYRLVGLTREFILSLFPMVGKHIVYRHLRRRTEQGATPQEPTTVTMTDIEQVPAYEKEIPVPDSTEKETPKGSSYGNGR